jgi:hypothetical protein
MYARTGQSPAEIAMSVDAAMDNYKANKYDRLRLKAQEYVLKHYSAEEVVKRYYLPAVEAYRQGKRGLLTDTRSKIMVRNDKCVASEYSSTYSSNSSSSATVAGLSSTSRQVGGRIDRRGRVITTTGSRIPILANEDIERLYIHPK